jgi:ATP-dependent DNA helicase PIF1
VEDNLEELQPTTATPAPPANGLDEEVDLDFEDAPPPRCAFLTGAAGTGKTYQVREKIRNDPTEGVLCATTGIAGVNLGAVTINSLLRYFDTESLLNAYVSGRLVTRLVGLAKLYRNLYVDEVSMMAAEQLDVLYQAVRDANQRKSVQKARPEGLGLVLTGDFAQLPPIKARWAFEADCWPQFETGTTRLEKNWRQGEGEFLAAINLLRSGDGPAGAAALRSTPAQFVSSLDLQFPGTTIMSKNDEVDRFNWVALQRVRGEAFSVGSRRWHMGMFLPSEWKHVPVKLELKIGAYVTVLANDTKEFRYANGDCGWIVARTPTSVQVRLVRTNEVVEIGLVERRVHVTDLEDSNYNETNTPRRPTWGEPWFDETAEKYVIGAVKYLPLRLAWASTVHKSQGLTLDRVQLDIRNGFFGKPAMAYVAVSRCRTAEGLRIVGDERLLAQRCCIDPKIKQWV